MVETVQTGVDGLDRLLGGGIHEGAAVLVSGSPGTGKSILGMQYLYNGIERYDEPGIYLSFEERYADIEGAANSVGLQNWEEHVEAEDILVYDKRQLLSDDEFSESLDRLLEDLSVAGYSRLVMDSFSMFEMFFDTNRETRRYLLEFVDILKEYEVTSLLLSEQGGLFPEVDVKLESFLTDGNIYLIQTPTRSGVNRYLWVAKMRRQNVDTDIFPMEISSEKGISIHDDAAGFSMLEDEFDPGMIG